MMRSLTAYFKAACLLLATGLLVGLVLPAAPALASDSVEDGVRRVARQLRCPICESVSVADSPAELAVQMRALIRKKLEAGESDQQIIDYFVAAYGDSVLLEPPRRGIGWAVWLGPVFVLAAGTLILWVVLRLWVRPSPRPGQPLRPVRRQGTPEAEFEATARQELESIREGLSR